MHQYQQIINLTFKRSKRVEEATGTFYDLQMHFASQLLGFISELKECLNL